MKELSWAEVQKLPSGSLVRSVWKEREGNDDPVCYYFVVKQEAAVPQRFTSSMIGEGTLRFFPEDVAPRFGDLNLACGNMVGFVYTHEGVRVSVGTVVLSALKHFVFEPDDVSKLLSTTMNLLAGYNLIKQEADDVRAKAAKPLFGRDAF